MALPGQIITFFFFLVSFTSGRAQECLREAITYEKIEQLGKDSFADGETVKLKCMTGYIGFYKLTCTKGQWLTFLAQSCSKKKCGHPGETPNGYFKLVAGNDFTYGAIVEYTCKEGYEMASRINRRNCKMKGWDNSIPVCEEVRCPVIRTDGNVAATGNTQEGTYGDVIYFKCVSSAEKLDGSSVIRCMENGNWSGPVPQCIVTCQLDIIESGAKSTIPHGKTGFKVGETVNIFCSDIKLLFQKQETFTCTNTGNWDYKPTCEEVTCKVPHGQHVYLPKFYFKEDMSLKTVNSYSCESGYHKTAEIATCTRGGWAPKPLCAEITCEPPNIPNARFVGVLRPNYKISSTIDYKCQHGFEPEELTRITCDSQGKWTGIKFCTGKLPLDGSCQEQELKNVKVLFGYPSFNLPYKPGHILVFKCTNDNMRFYGQRAIECQSDGRWSYPYPQCGGTIQCSQPIKNLRFVTVTDGKSVYSSSEILRYTCNEPYKENPDGVLMCQNGKWNGTFDCKSKTCPPPPYLEHGDFSISSTDNEVITAVSYTCQSYYLLNKQQESYKCVNGIWEIPPKCLRPCVIDDIVEKYNLQTPPEKIYLIHGNNYKLDCRDGWKTGSEMKTHVDVTCSDGTLQIQQSCNTQK